MIVVFVKPPNVDDNYTFKNVINLANKEFSDNIMLKKFLIR